MKKTNANATWSGTIKGGQGNVKLPSTGYETPFTFAGRFEDGDGTNPEELIGAALAGCFSMALSLNLEQEGAKPENIETNAEVTLSSADGGFQISEIALKTRVSAEGAEEGKFKEIAEMTKKTCPVSQALGAVRITLDASLA